MLTATYGFNGITDAITTPAQALEWAQKFETFLTPLPADTSVIVVTDTEPGTASSYYASDTGIATISESYLKALDKAMTFVAEGSFPVAAGPVPGALKNLGAAGNVLESVRGLVTGLQMAPSGRATVGKLYSRKAAIGVAAGVGLLAAFAAFAVGWAHKPGPSSFVYPS